MGKKKEGLSSNLGDPKPGGVDYDAREAARKRREKLKKALEEAGK